MQAAILLQRRVRHNSHDSSRSHRDSSKPAGKLYQLAVDVPAYAVSVAQTMMFWPALLSFSTCQLPCILESACCTDANIASKTELQVHCRQQHQNTDEQAESLGMH